MAVLGPERAPRAGGRAVGVLDGIQRVLHQLPHLVQRHDLLVRHAAIDDEERLRAEVLAHLEILVKAEAVRRVILPDVVLGAALGRVADGLLPAVGQAHHVAFDPAAAGEADEARLQPGQHLGQVGPQAVRAALPGPLRKERHHVQPERAGPAGADNQARLGVGGVGRQREPVAASNRELRSRSVCLRIDNPVAALQRDASGPLKPSPPRAKSESSYVCALATAMPQ